ncbi:MAG: tryptophan synthase subunit alpha [Phycisphaerae bacterium]|nr:tryptophan synthase subunit alpha [Phycisphaerae bacterium]
MQPADSLGDRPAAALSETFAALRARGEMALMPFLTAGYPTRPAFLEHLRTVIDAGADLIEIGIPFCDPIADGPTIQHSSQVALENGARLRDILDDLAPLEPRVPLIAMSYLNPLIAMPRERLFERLRAAHVRGLIIPDLPADEATEWSAATREAGLCLALLAAPTSPDERLRLIGRAAAGFVYAVSLAGTTGARSELPPELPAFLRRVRAAAGLPVAVGFGISRAEQIRSLRGLADGVVVGSRLVEAIRRGEDVAALIAELKHAIRAPREGAGSARGG